MIVTVALCVLLPVLFLVFEVRRRQSVRWQQLSKFPGDYPWPLIGNALQLGFDADEASNRLMEIWKRLGKSNFRMDVGTEQWVLLCEPDDIATLLSHPSELAKSPERNAAMKPFFGLSVSTSEGERWRTIRKQMTPSFHFKTLEGRVDAVNSRCKPLIEIIDSYGGTTMELNSYIRRYMFDILCNTLMGVDYNFLEKPDESYVQAVGRVCDIVNKNYFSYWRNIGPIFSLTNEYKEMMSTIKIIRDKSDEIINDRRSKLKKIINEEEIKTKHMEIDLQSFISSKLSEDSCLLDTLLLSKFPNGDPIQDEMINEEITLICFTGQFTTATAVTHTLYCLTKYPEIQDKVMKEQRDTFNNDLLRDPTHKDLNEMKYLEAVIKETMRYIPTVPKIGRHLYEDLKLKDGRVIPAKCTVLVYYEALYYNDKVYPNPEKFDPDRFLDSNTHTFSFVPFSAGPRNCIGFRFAWVVLKATLSNILRRYEVLPGGPGTTPQFVSRLITESTNGIQVKLKRRT